MPASCVAMDLSLQIFQLFNSSGEISEQPDFFIVLPTIFLVRVGLAIGHLSQGFLSSTHYSLPHTQTVNGNISWAGKISYNYNQLQVKIFDNLQKKDIEEQIHRCWRNVKILHFLLICWRNVKILPFFCVQHNRNQPLFNFHSAHIFHMSHATRARKKERRNRVAKCHEYGGYIRVKKLEC